MTHVNMVKVELYEINNNKYTYERIIISKYLNKYK
jgi:hypothetical protein